MTMNLIKLITFDATNTILRFRIPPWQYYSVVARDYGYEVKEEILKSRMKESFKVMNVNHPNFGKSCVNWENWWRKLVQMTFKNQIPNNANIDEIATKLINEFRTTRCWTVAESSHKLLQLLKNNGLTIGVISNFDPRLNDILTNLDIHKNFDFILTSYDVGYSKPDKRIFMSAMEASKRNLKVSECLHIGDDLEKDYIGSKSAGWHALLVGSHNMKHKAVAQGHVFSSMEELTLALEQNKIRL